MSRRRRQRNPLLVRIVLISLGAHIIALPILAHFGAFDKVRRTFGTATVVMLSPEKAPPKPPALAKKPRKQQTQNASHGQSKGKQAAARRDLVHVAVQNGAGGDGGPSVEQGTGKGGELPPGAGQTNKQPSAPTNPGGPTKPPALAKPDTPPVVTTKHTEPPPPPPPPPPVKHVPVYTEVEATYQPEPQIPDDLLDSPLDKTATVEVTVSADGSISDAVLGQSCGIGELDDLALKTARTWRFRPATADGAPVEGKVRIHIEFKVE